MQGFRNGYQNPNPGHSLELRASDGTISELHDSGPALLSHRGTAVARVLDRPDQALALARAEIGALRKQTRELAQSRLYPDRNREAI
jgi:hypothetical protein